MSGRVFIVAALALGGCAATSAVPAPSTPLLPVVRVVDGDTLVVSRDGSLATVRVLGIDTPETVDPGKPVQCGGPRATEAARELLTGKRVNIAADPTQDAADRYGRELVYVTLEDGTDYGLEQLRRGNARAYKVKGPAPQRYNDYLAAQVRAQADKEGMWGSCLTS